jgi:phage-related protein
VEIQDKELIWLHGEVKTPPFSEAARRTAGYFLRFLQRGMSLSMPASRPMPSIGPRCHELRIPDGPKRVTWRIVYRIDDVFAKKTQKTPQATIAACERRFKLYDLARE